MSSKLKPNRRKFQKLQKSKTMAKAMNANLTTVPKFVKVNIISKYTNNVLIKIKVAQMIK